jgi:hypothetical protein
MATLEFSSVEQLCWIYWESCDRSRQSRSLLGDRICELGFQLVDGNLRHCKYCGGVLQIPLLVFLKLVEKLSNPLFAHRGAPN